MATIDPGFSTLVEAILKHQSCSDLKHSVKNLESWMHFGLKSENATIIRNSLEEIFPHIYGSFANRFSKNDSLDPAVLASLLAAFLDTKAWDGFELCAKDAIWCELNLMQTPVYLIDVVLQMDTKNVHKKFLTTVALRIFSLPRTTFNNPTNTIRLFMFYKWLVTESPTITKPTIMTIVKEYINMESFLMWLKLKGISANSNESSEELIIDFFETNDLMALSSFLSPEDGSDIGENYSPASCPARRRLVEIRDNGLYEQIHNSDRCNMASSEEQLETLSSDTEESESQVSPMSSETFIGMNATEANLHNESIRLNEPHLSQPDKEKSITSSNLMAESSEVLPPLCSDGKITDVYHHSIHCAQGSSQTDTLKGDFFTSHLNKSMTPVDTLSSYGTAKETAREPAESVTSCINCPDPNVSAMDITEDSFVPLSGTPLLRKGHLISQHDDVVIEVEKIDNVRAMDEDKSEANDVLSVPKEPKRILRRALSGTPEAKTRERQRVDPRRNQRNRARYFLRKRTSE